LDFSSRASQKISPTSLCRNSRFFLALVCIDPRSYGIFWNHDIIRLLWRMCHKLISNSVHDGPGTYERFKLA
jgi:hypothetical protein